MILILFILEFIAYLGVIRLQRNWYRRGELTEHRFVLFQVTNWSLFVLTGFMIVSTKPEGFILAVVASIICWIISYPIALWMYRRIFLRK